MVTPALKLVPSSIFLPLRLSWFLFSLDASSALIDFKIEVNELSSFTFLFTSCWVADDWRMLSADANLLLASAIIDCCFVLFLILSSWDFSSSIFSSNKDLSISFVLVLSWLFSPDWDTNFSSTALATFS